MQKISQCLNNINDYKKLPKYEWQELALDIIEKLKAENKGLIFKICKKYPKSFVMHCLEETLELAKGDNKDRYFVKLIYKK